MVDEPPLKPVIWIGSSRKDLREFPEPVQDHMGYALYVAQRGGKHRDAKALTGFGGAGSSKSSRTIAATRSARYTPCDIPVPYMSFTPSRRNRRPGGRPHVATWS